MRAFLKWGVIKQNKDVSDEDSFYRCIECGSAGCRACAGANKLYTFSNG